MRAGIRGGITRSNAPDHVDAICLRVIKRGTMLPFPVVRDLQKLPWRSESDDAAPMVVGFYKAPPEEIMFPAVEVVNTSLKAESAAYRDEQD